MAVKYKHSEEFTTYFVTFTCYKWISLFETTNSYDILSRRGFRQRKL